MSMSPMRNADHPCNDGQGGGDREYGPTAGIDAVQLQPAAGVPPQMPDAVAQMIEQREAPAEQEQEANPRAKKALDRGIRFGSIGRGAEPPHQQDRPDDERDPVGAMQNRHQGG